MLQTRAAMVNVFIYTLPGIRADTLRPSDLRTCNLDRPFVPGPLGTAKPKDGDLIWIMSADYSYTTHDKGAVFMCR